MAHLSRRDTIAFVLAAVVGPEAVHAQARGRYIGTVVTTWLPNRLMRLENDFEYIDPHGRRWPVPPGIQIDGASIPPAAWSFIGGPFSGLYREASVIHDHYCDRRTRSQDDTHRVFYDGMITSGVERWRAGLMYGAVLVGGPKWSTVRVRSASLAEVQNVFGANNRQTDWAARLAASSAIDAAGLFAGRLASSRDETFAALTETLPEATDIEQAWQMSAESPTTTIGRGEGSVGAQVLARQDNDLLIGIEENLPFTEADFQALADRLGQADRAPEEIEVIANEQVSDIRAREPL